MTSQSTWSSDNTSVSTVVSAGTFYGAAAGSFNAQAQITLLDADADCPEGSHSPCPTDPWKDQSPSTVVKVQITSADITQDKIAVVLSGPPSASGNLNVQVTGPNGQPPIDPITNGTVGPNTYNYSFGLTNIPIGEYTTITATRTVNGTNITAAYSYHFKVMGTYLQTQYNTPAESSCGGSAEAVTIYTPSCSSSPGSMLNNFVSRVSDLAAGTGSGHSTEYQDVQSEAPCVKNIETAFRGHATITETLGTLNNSTVAVTQKSELYATGTRVFIVGEGVKTVTDRCGNGCPDLNHLDNYNTSTQCSGLGNLPSALTIRLY